MGEEYIVTKIIRFLAVALLLGVVAAFALMPLAVFARHQVGG